MLQFNMRTAREGVRWHLIESSRGKYQFDSLLPMIDAANEIGIQVIWDLFHFGWPEHLDIFEPVWVEAFREFTFQFATVWKRESGKQPAFIVPVNEISFLSYAGADKGFLNPFVRNRGGELKAQLIRGALASAAVIRAELPDAVVVSTEPVIHIVGKPSIPGDIESAEAYRRSMFEAWDMLTGRLHPELGGHPCAFDVIGINYYDSNQWWNFGETIFLGEPEYRPFHRIIEEVFERYRYPLFIAETGTEDDYRPYWFAYIASEVRTATQVGIPVHGICLYPCLNHPGWEDDRHCFNGLWDYADAHGTREVYQPLADEICRQEKIRQSVTKGITP